MSRGTMHSEQTAREIDEEVRRIIDDSIENVAPLARKPPGVTRGPGQTLMEREVIDGEEMRRIIEETSPGPWIVPGTANERNRRAVPVVEAPELREASAAEGLGVSGSHCGWPPRVVVVGLLHPLWPVSRPRHTADRRSPAPPRGPGRPSVGAVSGSGDPDRSEVD